MAKANKNKDDRSKYYSYLLVNQTRKAGFLIITTVIFILMIMVIGEHILHGKKSWVYAAASLTLLGVPVMLYSPIEHWVYKPWQAKAQKYERHYKD